MDRPDDTQGLIATPSGFPLGGLRPPGTLPATKQQEAAAAALHVSSSRDLHIRYQGDALAWQCWSAGQPMTISAVAARIEEAHRGEPFLASHRRRQPRSRNACGVLHDVAAFACAQVRSRSCTTGAAALRRGLRPQTCQSGGRRFPARSASMSTSFFDLPATIAKRRHRGARSSRQLVEPARLI